MSRQEAERIAAETVAFTRNYSSDQVATLLISRLADAGLLADPPMTRDEWMAEYGITEEAVAETRAALQARVAQYEAEPRLRATLMEIHAYPADTDHPMALIARYGLGNWTRTGSTIFTTHPALRRDAFYAALDRIDAAAGTPEEQTPDERQTR